MTGTHGRVELGLQHHGAGRLREAETLYREALAEDPQNIDALHFLGVIALQRGDTAQAVALISQALSRNAANPPAFNNLGLALAAQGKRREAVSAWLDALALQPDYPDAQRNLRANLSAGGRLQRDAASDAHFNQGNAHKDQGRLEEAIACYRNAARLAPDYAAAHVNLGSALAQQGRDGEAVGCFRKALVLEPELAEAWFNLGVSAFRLGDLASATPALEKTRMRDWPATIRSPSDEMPRVERPSAQDDALRAVEVAEVDPAAEGREGERGSRCIRMVVEASDVDCDLTPGIVEAGGAGGSRCRMRSAAILASSATSGSFIAASAIAEDQLAHIKTAMERGRTPEGIRAVIERGKRIKEIMETERKG